MMKAQYFGLLLIVFVAGCASGEDGACNRSLAMSELANLGSLAAYATSPESGLTEAQQKGLLLIGSSMAISAAVHGVPREDELRGIHEDGILWLMSNRQQISDELVPEAERFLVKSYEPVVADIEHARQEMIERLREQPVGE